MCKRKTPVSAGMQRTERSSYVDRNAPLSMSLIIETPPAFQVNADW